MRSVSRGGQDAVVHYTALVAVSLLVGCGTAKPSRAVIDLRLDEGSVPLPFVIAIRSDGEAAQIQGVSVKLLNEWLISRPQDAERIPSGFDYDVEFSDDHPTEIPANSDGVACGFLVWQLPPDPPPMIALATCEFLVHFRDGETIATEPITIVLQSAEGVVASGDGPLAGEQAQQALAVLERVQGAKSAGFDKLLNQLRDSRTGQAERSRRHDGGSDSPEPP